MTDCEKSIGERICETVKAMSPMERIQFLAFVEGMAYKAEISAEKGNADDDTTRDSA